MARTIEVQRHLDYSVIGCARDEKTVGSGNDLLPRNLTNPGDCRVLAFFQSFFGWHQYGREQLASVVAPYSSMNVSAPIAVSPRLHSAGSGDPGKSSPARSRIVTPCGDNGIGALRQSRPRARHHNDRSVDDSKIQRRQEEHRSANQ
jgi:hypothetical protein